VIEAATRSAIDLIWDTIDLDELCQLALDLTAIPSPTGEEEALAAFILERFEAADLRTVRQEVEPGRLNAVGIVPGRGTGPSLMFNGHMDTGKPIRHEEVLAPGPPPAEVMESRREGELLLGTGMDNMKSGLAAIITAAIAVRRSKVSLGGDLIVAGVAGEIGRAPVDQFQGRHYRSKGVGTRYLLTHGILSDYAIVADTSHFGLTWAECGVVYAKISTGGQGLYTPFTRRSPDPRSSHNAIVKMTVIIEALEEWAADYERRSVYSFAGGEIHPKVSIGSIAAGAPFKVANTPLNCSIYVDVRMPPGMLPIQIRGELEAVLRSTGIDHQLDLYLSQRGYEGTGVEPIVASIHEGHEMVAGEPPPPIDPAETSMWTDTNLYAEAGIPAVKFGIGAAVEESPDGEMGTGRRIPESTRVDDLIKACKVYAASAAILCHATPTDG
jgi:acetylornithine deacetylase/succinyl-diaminopimelate desuccinylase-like protein